ncbi:MAG: fumarylacetoacetate hydrolase family protein, partial [Planctomycetota bacterium]
MTTIYCVGRNYAAHAREMGAVPSTAGEPVIFLKPEHARLAAPGPIVFPPDAEEIHYEAELVVRVGDDRAPAAV